MTDGLKVLPINIMMCDKVLALNGDSYTKRLWCIWELFVLFSFGEGNANKLIIRSLDDDTESLEEQLLEFDVANAHAYDPNEEKRLRSVIKANGLSEFNEKIRGFAKKLSTVPPRTSLGSLSSTSTRNLGGSPNQARWATRSSSISSKDLVGGSPTHE